MKALVLSLGIYSFATVVSQAADPVSYDAHEWGTFTDVQGSDGAQMVWEPLTAVELPAFVHNNTGGVKGFAIAGKTGTACVQRLETPVIYFYSDRAFDVNVAVDFPEGRITEWYPQRLSPVLVNTFQSLRGVQHPPSILWEDVHVTPLASKEAGTLAPLAVDKTGSHYYAARETDSALLQTASAKGAPETEKFLFYRGVGSFEAPVTVKLEGADGNTVRIENHENEELLDLYLFQNIGPVHGWLKINRLSPGESRTVARSEIQPAASQEDLRQALQGEFRAALVRQGLYEREAAAMVKTWENTWFGEPGLRVLYPVARRYTDTVLPIKFDPAPKTLVRVMVGRAEIVTPEMESCLENAMNRYVKAGEDKDLRAQIAAEVHGYGFGRFCEPILRRVIHRSEHSKEFNSLSWNLLEEANALDRAAEHPEVKQEPVKAVQS